MGDTGVGDTLADRYRLGDLLGSGGMAEVRRARDLVLDREVAVKVLRDTVDDTDRRRFVGEARTLAQLAHVGLVTVLDAGTSDGQPYLVMELVEGRTLGDALAQGPLPAAEVARIGAQVAAALGYAHDQGVVHRDVKPGNVLLGRQGQVKLADFGIARLIGDAVRHTRTGTTIGTPAYLSPEQVRGEPVGPASDVYSLGLVLLEALTGKRAYPGTPAEAAIARLHRPPEVPDDLPPGWRDLLLEMTATAPGARPAAGVAADRLRGLVGRGAASPHPTPAAVDAVGDTRVLPPQDVASTAVLTGGGTPTRRRPIAILAAVVVGCLLLAAAVIAILAATSGGPDGELPEQTPSRPPTESPTASPTTPSVTTPSPPTSETVPEEEHGKDHEPKGKGPKEKERGKSGEHGRGKGPGKGKP